jgi:hypothetical protein
MSSTSSPHPKSTAGGVPDSETRRQSQPGRLPKDRGTAGTRLPAMPGNSAADRPKVKQIARKPVPPGPLPERGSRRFSDEQPELNDSLREKIDRGEEIATPGGKRESGDRDIHDEEWRAHDSRGPYGQRRRRRN